MSEQSKENRQMNKQKHKIYFLNGEKDETLYEEDKKISRIKNRKIK